jgi:hypothetical protein
MAEEPRDRTKNLQSVPDAGAPPQSTPAPSRARRDFLKGLAVVASVQALIPDAVAESAAASPVEPGTWPHYVLRRSSDGLYIRLQTIGYAETRFLGKRWLKPVVPPARTSLVFGFPPQHFAETAISDTAIPEVLSEEVLNNIKLLESEPAQIVLRDKRGAKLCLELETLLDWDKFDLVLPDVDVGGNSTRTTPEYALEPDFSTMPPVSRVEMPWGIELLPAPDAAGNNDYIWKHSTKAKTQRGWTQLWTTSLVRRSGRSAAMELLSIRGFEQVGRSGSVAGGDLQVKYQARSGTVFPADPTPLTNYDRINLATSLSSRFPYTGRSGPEAKDSGLLVYQLPNTTPSVNACVMACYADNRSLTVSQFRVSALGGWLQLDGQWNAFPGCLLTGWIHQSSLGRDHHVEIIAAGFLYPFGIPCQLTVLTERVFVPDIKGHFIAVLLKQAFLQIPQGNLIQLAHRETPFVTLSVTTRRTPPLDVPSDGDPATYLKYDFFLPTVDKRPFVFEHVGLDWGGEAHSSAMPMYFVSNKARDASGLVWEPGLTRPSQQRTACESPPPAAGDDEHSFREASEGLRFLDALWHRNSYRFAHYGRSLVALGKSALAGDTSHRVDWIEWVRGSTAMLALTGYTAQPFQTRARTLRIMLEGITQMSGQQSALIGTYRDTRSVLIPVLDPEPTAPLDLYLRNILPGGDGAEIPFLYILEARPLLALPAGLPASSAQQRALQMRDSYFGSSTGSMPEALFSNLDNEIGFGKSANSEAVGGISVPDLHVSTLTRAYGPVGDATFNERRWPGYAAKKEALELIKRVDFAAFRRQARQFVDSPPFDPVRSDDNLLAFSGQARAMMGFSTAPALFGRSRAGGLPTPNLKLGDLFGLDAEILPGLPFSKIFQTVGLSDVPEDVQALSVTGERNAQPLAWNVRITGIEDLLALTGAGPGQLTLPQLLTLLAQNPQADASPEFISAGMEASLNWSNDIFRSVDLGLVKFDPGTSPRLEIAARSNVDLGRISIAPDLRQLRFKPGRATTSAKAQLSDFRITLFNAIIVHFTAVTFELSPDGKKDFAAEIGDITLTGPLAFVNQLSAILGGLGGDQGIKIDLSPARIIVSQTLRFPPDEGTPLFIGPAQIINLALSWAVNIPLRGRDVMSIAFAISSRDKPLTIFVPPWYGGKAHVLLELTTKGCRLIEISMEYGALIPVTWTLTRGMASITAGIFYMCRRSDSGGEVQLMAFVKAACDLRVARIIQFSGLIFISLSDNRDSSGESLVGTATVRVSIKIAFVRVSYSFTAQRVEKRSGQRLLLSPGGPAPASEDSLQPFGSQFSLQRRQAFERLLNGYST